MSEILTVTTPLISPSTDRPLTPAMVSVVWSISDALDKLRLNTDVDNAVWIEIPTAQLRGDGGRSDNVWLRECFNRLMGIKFNGEFTPRASAEQTPTPVPWGAVLLAEWQITRGGSVARLNIPAAAINAIRAPQTFSKIETYAAYKLDGHARKLYAILADKKRLNRTYWEFPLDELRQLLGVEKRPSYQRWNNFRQWVLDPALESINDFGTVTVKMTPQKFARTINAVRFDWEWKDLHQAAQTARENERVHMARNKPLEPRSAPPLIPEVTTLTSSERSKPGTEASRKKIVQENLARLNR